MNIKMTELSYNLNDGVTKSVIAAFSAHDTEGNSLNTRVSIREVDLPGERAFDDMTKSEYENLAKLKMKDWLGVEV